jgi:hypothetical protein
MRACRALWLALALAGCGGDEPPVPQVFAPLHYDYLPKIRLNVASIDVQDHAPPAQPPDLAATSPVPPTQALEQMAHDRLFADGVSGSASFVIDQASILQEPNGTLDGRLAVHLEIKSGTGASAGYAEAEVSRQHIPGSDPEDLRSELYTITRRMMDDMNVEFEFQVRRTLGRWLVSTTAVPAPVVAQPLPAPGPSPAPLPAATPPVSPPDAPAPNGYQDPLAPPPPPQMSPPPSFLHLPGTQAPAALPPANGY